MDQLFHCKGYVRGNGWQEEMEQQGAELSMKIAVMGGKRAIRKLDKLFHKSVEIAFFIDNNLQISEKMINNKKVYSPYDFPRGIADYIVILVYEYETVYQELLDLGVDADHIINLNDPGLDLFTYEHIFDIDTAERLMLELRMDYMDRRIKALEDEQRYFEQNYLYEAVGVLKNRRIQLPKIDSVENTYAKIIDDRCSISRYGDGEFEIILGNKAVYQHGNVQLAMRLQDILTSTLRNHIVAIADDYGTMEGLRKENKNTIRKYMTEDKRKAHYALLDMDRKYYNAYISRPYVIYPHDEVEKAQKRFEDLKQIWDKQDVLFVEGDKTRMGIGNDLFDNARKIERIIAPNENAFDVYDEIYEAVLENGKDKVILIALGPTATVLAYDLAKEGYWALDIGHLDLEYEWFLKGKGYSYIPHKYNNEMLGDTRVAEIFDKSYEESIMKRILPTHEGLS